MKKSYTKKVFAYLLIGTIVLNVFFLNASFNPILKGDGQHLDDEINENIKNQALVIEDEIPINEGIAAPWNVTHWANRTDHNLPISFSNGTTDSVNLYMGAGWEGYYLDGYIDELYDTRNWVNGSFHAGTDDGNPSNQDDDSSYLRNWTFGNVDSGWTNYMSGNYFDGSGDIVTGEDYLELRIQGYGSNDGYDHNDRCWWESDFTLPRGDIAEGEINLAVYPETQFNPVSGTGEYGTHFSIQVYLNGQNIDDKNLNWLEEQAGYENWYNLKLQLTNWLDDPTVFPEGEKDMNLRIQLIRNGPTLEYGDYGQYQQVFIDNVSLIVKAQAKPEQLGLRMNSQAASDINWSTGTVEQTNSWTSSPVGVTFDTTEVWPLGDYDVEFEADLNLYTRKVNDESEYQSNSIGSSYEVLDDGMVEWESYARVSVPTAYQQTDMSIRVPTDYDFTWISNSEYRDTNILQYCDNSTDGILKINNFSDTPDGLWRIKAVSPNYCDQINIYNNESGSWTLNNTFLSGDGLRIWGRIVSPEIDISSYITSTQAILDIVFPNGTIWSAASQIKQVESTGWIYFDPIQIPTDHPNYEVGDYTAIITWNNSHSSFGINETGIITQDFKVVHDSKLEPDLNQYYIEDVSDDSIVNVKVSFNDLVDNTAITGASVYANFFGSDEYFSEVSPGFYLFEFNASKASAGNNSATVYANDAYYLNKSIEITIEVIKETILTTNISGIISVPFNANFSVQFNYTEKNSGDGIDTTYISHTWNNGYISQIATGQYILTCNTSGYSPNSLQSLTITINPPYYEAKATLINIQITQITTDPLVLWINGEQRYEDDTIVTSTFDTLNISIEYRSFSTHLTDADQITLYIGGVPLDNLTEDLGNEIYWKEIDVDVDLTDNTNSISIIAEKEGYDTKSIGFLIIIEDVQTRLTTNISDIITVPYLSNFSVQLNYTYESTGLGIDIGLDDISHDWDPSNAYLYQTAPGLYILTCNTSASSSSTLESLRIIINPSGYEAQAILINIDITEIGTDPLVLWINGIQRPDGYSFETDVYETLNISVEYRSFGRHLGEPSSVRMLLGTTQWNLTEDASNEIYTRLIPVVDLNGSLNIKIYADKDGYDYKDVDFTVFVGNVQTTLDIILNNENKTLDPFIDVAIGRMLNISVIYKDRFGDHIENASLTLYCSNPLLNYEFEEISSSYYYFMINSTDFIGEELAPRFIIKAQKAYFEPHQEDIYVNFRPRFTEIVPIVSQLEYNLTEGSNLRLEFKVNDTEFNEIVEGLTLRYNITFAQYRVLTEFNGTYEAYLSNLPAGTYELKVYIDEDSIYYGYAEIVITLNVLAKGEADTAFLELIIQILIIAGIVGAIAFSAYIYAYQKVLKYPKPVRKVRKYKSNLRKRNFKGPEVEARERSFEALYKGELGNVGKVIKTQTTDPSVIAKQPLDKALKKPIEDIPKK